MAVKMTPLKKKVDRALKRKGLTHKQLADFCGTNRRTLQDWLNGNRPVPLEALQVMAADLGLKLEELEDLAEQKPGETHG